MAIEVTPAAAPAATPAATPAAPDTTAEAAKAASVVGSDPWFAKLPDDLKTNPTLAKYKTDVEAHKGHVELAAAYGKKLEGMVKVPGADAKPDEIAAFRAAVGVPEKPEGYTFQFPEGVTVNQAVLGNFQKMAHDLGLPPATFQKLVAFDLNRVQAAQEAVQRDAVAKRETGEAALKKEWGPAYDHKLAMVQRFAEQVGGDELLNELELSGKGASPILIKFLDKVAAMAEKGGFVKGEPVAPITKDGAQRRISEIMADKDWKTDFDNPTRHAELVKEYAKLIHLR